MPRCTVSALCSHEQPCHLPGAAHRACVWRDSVRKRWISQYLPFTRASASCRESLTCSLYADTGLLFNPTCRRLGAQEDVERLRPAAGVTLCVTAEADPAVLRPQTAAEARLYSQLAQGAAEHKQAEGTATETVTVRRRQPKLNLSMLSGT